MVAGEFVRDLFLIFRPQGQRKSRRGRARAGCFGEGEVVVNLMCSARIDFIGVRHGGETLAGVSACETDAAGRARSQDRERGFVETLKINRAGVVCGAQSTDRRDEDRGAFLFERDYFGEIEVAFEQAPPLRFDETVNASSGKCIAQRGGGGQGVDYVAERAEADEEEARVRHCRRDAGARVVRAWNAAWDRRRSRPGCRAGRLVRVREPCQRCSPCLWRGRLVAVL